MPAYFLENIVDGERCVVYFYRSFDDAFGQAHVYLAVVNHGVGHQTVDDALQVANASVGSLGDKLRYIDRDAQSVASDFAVQDVDAELNVGLFQFGNDAAGEASEQALAHALQFYRGPIAGQDDALPVAEEVIEDVEKRFLRLLGVHPSLHIVDDEQVDGLITLDEVVGHVLEHGIDKLLLEEVCTDIQHSFLGVELLGLYADGIDEMGFPATRRSVDEQGVELIVVGMLGYR